MYYKISTKKGLLAGLLLSALTAAPAMAKITPSDVFMQTQRGLAEVELIRSNKGIGIAARKVGVQKKKRPLHVFGKCVEVVEKVVRLQELNSVSLSVIPDIPLRDVTPSEVHDCTQVAIDGLRAVKEKLGIAAKIAESDGVKKKTPSHVYRNMWQLSYLLDTLVGQISPSEVFRNVKSMQDELAMVAKEKSITLTGSVVAVTGKKPGDVLISCFNGLTLLKKVQRKLKVSQLKVPKVPSGKILPSDAYDCTNTQLTELHVIKVELGMTKNRVKQTAPTGKTPSDVFAEMELYKKQVAQVVSKL
jgi:hypothetical protein